MSCFIPVSIFIPVSAGAGAGAIAGAAVSAAGAGSCLAQAANTKTAETRAKRIILVISAIERVYKIQAISNYGLRARRVSNLDVVLRLSRKGQHGVSHPRLTVARPHGPCHGNRGGFALAGARGSAQWERTNGRHFRAAASLLATTAVHC